MEWSDEDYEELALAQGREATPAERRASLEAIASRAVELAAARAGMDLGSLEGAILGATSSPRDAGLRKVWLGALSGLGARIAALEAARDAEGAARTAAEGWIGLVRGELSARGFPALDRTVAMESIRRVLTERDAALNRAEHAEARVRELAIAGQALSEHVDRTTGGCDCAATGIACIHWARRAAPYPERHPHAFVRPPHGGAGCWSGVASGGRCAWPEDAHVVGTKEHPSRPVVRSDTDARPFPERQPHDFVVGVHLVHLGECAFLTPDKMECGYSREAHGVVVPVGKACGNCEDVQPETCAKHADSTSAACNRCDNGNDAARCTCTDRFPCSTTCTHDDAATPGHPERVKERGEATQQFISRADADDGGAAAESAAYECGVETMRAACWGAVQVVLQKHGWSGEHVVNDFKAAIEGAAP